MTSRELHRISIVAMLIPFVLNSCAQAVRTPKDAANAAEKSPAVERVIVTVAAEGNSDEQMRLAELYTRLELPKTQTGSMAEHVLSGRIANSRGQEERALHSYAMALSCEEATNENPLTGEALLEFSRLLVEQGYYQAAIDSYEKLAEVLPETDVSDPDSPALKSLAESPGRVRSSIGKLQDKLGQNRAAVATYEKARKLSADDAQVQMFCARGLVEIGEYKRALEILDELFENNSARGLAAQMLVGLRDKQGKASETVRDLEKLQSEYPDDGRIAVVLASYYLKNDQPTKAREILIEQTQINRYYVGAYQDLAELEIQQGHRTEAVQWLAKMVWANQAAIADARWRLLQMSADKDEAVKLLSELDQLKELRQDFALCWAAGTVAETAELSGWAHSYYRRAISLQPRFGQLYLYLIRSYLREGQADAGLAIIGAVEKAQFMPSSDFYRVEGLAYLLKENIDRAMVSLEAAVGANPRDSGAREILAGILLTIGRPDDAAKHLEVLIRENPDDESLLRQLITSHLADGRAERAVRAAERFMAFNRVHDQTALTAGQAFLEAKMYAQAVQILDGCPSEGLQLVYWRELLLESLVLDGQVGRVEQELNSWLAGAGTQNERAKLAGRMATALAEAEKLDMAVELATKELEAVPDNPLLQEAMVYLLIQKKDYQRAEELVSGWMGENPDRGKRLLAVSVLVANDKYKEAEDQLDRLISEDDKDIRAMHLLGSVYEFTGRLELACEKYLRILEISPEDVWANNNQGFYLAEANKQLDQAERMVRSALRWGGAESAIVDSMGWVYYKKGRFGQALGYIQRALRLAKEPGGEELEHLGDTYYRLAEVEQALEAWQKGLKAEQAGDRPDEARVKRLQKKLELIESGEKAPVAWSIVDAGLETQKPTDD